MNISKIQQVERQYAFNRIELQQNKEVWREKRDKQDRRTNEHTEEKYSV